MPDPFSAATITATARSPRTIAVDNFLRKSLRVSDPHDPSQIAAALLARYPEEAERERRERAGMAYSTLPEWSPTTMSRDGGASSAELAQARDDLERDLQTLASASPLKDIQIELAGWARAVRRIASDGLAAARLALDAVSHDRALSARRSLGEYARLSRYLGALNDGSALYFRRLAQSLDVIAALILVAMGEGLAASGITRSTALVRVAAGELQSRRNAVINALRNLVGSVELSLGQEEWPRGLDAYRGLVRRLDAEGQADLRSLLEENALASAMDELVDLATGASVQGLRELSTASALVINRFQRLVHYGQAIEVPLRANITEGSPESPPLVTFMASLQLFVDAFSRMGGGRLLYLARPPIVIYGLYGAGGPDEGAMRLVRLAILRGQLAEQVDCMAGCACDAQTTRVQVLLDYVLGGVDKALDFYAVGSDSEARGDPEKRAAALAFFINRALHETAPDLPDKRRLLADIPPRLTTTLESIERTLLEPFGQQVNGDWAINIDGQARVDELLKLELRLGYQAEAQTERLVRTLAPSCHFPSLFGYRMKRSLIRDLIFQILDGEVGLADPVQIPSPIASTLASMSQNRPDFWSSRSVIAEE